MIEASNLSKNIIQNDFVFLRTENLLSAAIIKFWLLTPAIRVYREILLMIPEEFPLYSSRNRERDGPRNVN